MSRIKQQFDRGPAYIGYVTAGDGGMQRTLEACLAFVAGGVDILEIGVPFSDPVADGPAIQQAAQRALEQGTNLEDVLQLIHDIRQQTDVPIILFSYYNPIFMAMQNGLFEKAKAVGVDGCLIVDLPIEEAANYEQICAENQIDPIFLLSPSTSVERIELIDKHSRGMVYYACRKGTTGVKSQLPDDFTEKVSEIKAHISLPLVAGFGMANKDMAKEVLDHANGFVVGSLFVNAIAEGKSAAELTALAKSLDPRKGN